MLDDRLIEEASGVADRRPATTASTSEGIRLLDRIGRMFATAPGASPGSEHESLFVWGTLEVRCLLGAGSFGEVYQAWDPALQRDVALKLRSSETGALRWLDEARNLARVRHPHVLTVHGADVLEGRAGIWTERVIGRTLEEELAPLPRSPDDIDFDDERRRAANEVVTARAAKPEYLTFSIDDVAAPRPEPEPEKLSIFDGTGARASRGPTAGQLGQARTKVGQKMSALCNALTGGFSLMGWGSFCAGPSDGGPSGLYPEVRPEYLDLMPECVDTRDTAPELALEAPFPTVKCRLVMPEEIGRAPGIAPR